ncbi:hypothetical protein M569_09291 [Genlisea aurea]|uniref:TATA box binding protein associated factor (TAF) histone-like fold domain-containing protein n=1 Tax=Genlisea aurea TaxID=192259 RepID=S8DQZ0_9LAMI|nr:hypothetical protein M569_09291 [Genlisea aurea]
MSIIPKETMEVIAQSIGITNLSPDVLPALAADVEYRVREIMQEAIKCMRHSRKTTLTTDDVDSALGLRNVEPIYGFATGDPLRFRRAAGHKDLFYIEEKDVEFKDVIEAPLPKVPLEPSVVAHWLAIEGVQPAIPENPPPEALQTLSQPAENRKSESKDDGVPVDIKSPIKHVLSRELQLYFEKINELTLTRSESVLFKRALVSLATDSGIHPLVPYFTFFIADEVSRNLGNYTLLFALMRLVWSLLKNPHIHVEPYVRFYPFLSFVRDRVYGSPLHQLMPSVMTCLVAKKLGNKVSDDHWHLRNFTSRLVASICKRFGHVYHNVQPRVTKTLLHAFLDPSKALPQHFGAIQGLSALGPNVVRLLILPNLESYLRLLDPEMQLEKQKNEVKRHEARLVYGALMCAAGLSVYDQLKRLPPVPSPPARTISSRSNTKVLVTPNKRKASIDNAMLQPPLKKPATDSSMAAINSQQQMDVGGGYPSNILQTTDGPSSSSSSSRVDTVGSKGVTAKMAAVSLDQAWKERVSCYQLLPALLDYFGESMFNFVPSPELSTFL